MINVWYPTVFQPSFLTATGPAVTAFLLGSSSDVILNLRRVFPSNLTGDGGMSLNKKTALKYDTWNFLNSKCVVTIYINGKIPTTKCMHDRHSCHFSCIWQLFMFSLGSIDSPSCADEETQWTVTKEQIGKVKIKCYTMVIDGGCFPSGHQCCGTSSGCWWGKNPGNLNCWPFTCFLLCPRL